MAIKCKFLVVVFIALFQLFASNLNRENTITMHKSRLHINYKEGQFVLKDVNVTSIMIIKILSPFTMVGSK